LDAADPTSSSANQTQPKLPTLLYKRDSVLEAGRLDRLCEIEMLQLLRKELSPSHIEIVTLKVVVTLGKVYRIQHPEDNKSKG